MATNSGAKDCFNLDNHHEIISEKDDFYKKNAIFYQKLHFFIFPLSISPQMKWNSCDFFFFREKKSAKIL